MGLPPSSVVVLVPILVGGGSWGESRVPSGLGAAPRPQAAIAGPRGGWFRSLGLSLSGPGGEGGGEGWPPGL